MRQCHIILPSYHICIVTRGKDFIPDLSLHSSKDYDCFGGECGDDDGSHQCLLENKCADKALELRVDKWDIYPGYVSDINGIPLNDIAIITLETPVNFTKFIQPICLPTLDNINSKEEKFTISGWGNTAKGLERFRPSQVLQYLVVEKVDHQDCEVSLNKYVNMYIYVSFLSFVLYS